MLVQDPRSQHEVGLNAMKFRQKLLNPVNNVKVFTV